MCPIGLLYFCYTDCDETIQLNKLYHENVKNSSKAKIFERGELAKQTVSDILKKQKGG